MSALYNEIEPYAADWLVNLEQAGHIASGRVDRRSIVDLTAADLASATQAHFFAGLGGWSYALRLAGVPDSAAVWTGSCPCQPFSAAGKRGGFDDPRHLWPAWFKLIKECRPGLVFGEQVASPDGLAWYDVVATDMESIGYSMAAADLCAASVGAPHLRQRLYFVGSLDADMLKVSKTSINRVVLGGQIEQIGPPFRMQDVRGHCREGASSGQPDGGSQLSDSIPQSKTSNDARSPCEDAGQAAECGVRPGHPQSRNSEEDRHGSVRGERLPVGPIARTKARQPIVGPDCSVSGLPLFEHSSCLLRHELRARQMGRGTASAGAAVLADEEGGIGVATGAPDGGSAGNANRGAALSALCLPVEDATHAERPEDPVDPGVGAPHLRQRLYFVADAGGQRLDGIDLRLWQQGADGKDVEAARSGQAGALADAEGCRRERREGSAESGARRGRDGLAFDGGDSACLVGDASGSRLSARERQDLRGEGWRQEGRAALQSSQAWADLEWLDCLDGKRRPTKPGLHPLAHGVPARVGKLRAGGNAIVPQVAATFIRAYLSAAEAA